MSKEMITSPAARYGFAVACLAAATVLRGFLGAVLGPTVVPFVTYYPAVILASWYGGLGPGLLVTGLAALIVQFLFIVPVLSFDVESPADALTLGVFMASSILLVWLNERREQGRRKAMATAGDTTRQLAEMTQRFQSMEEAERGSAEYKRWAADTLSSIGDGVICTDVDGCVTFLNEVAERLTGWTFAEARGKDIAEVFVIVNEYTRQGCATSK